MSMVTLCYCYVNALQWMIGVLILKITTSIRIFVNTAMQYIAYTLFIIIYIDDSFYTSSHDVIWGAYFSRTHFWWNHSRQPLKTSDATMSNINSSTTVNGSMFSRKLFCSMYWTSHTSIAVIILQWMKWFKLQICFRWKFIFF